LIVVDASVAVKWFVNEPGHRAALALTTGREVLGAPDFALLEILNVLRRKLRSGNMTSDQFRAASQLLPCYFDQLVPASQLVNDSVVLSSDLDHSIYDCAYLACARLTQSVLLTADLRFVDKAERAGYGALVRRLDPV
jgi:predicted nucleic acid-binding protein